MASLIAAATDSTSRPGTMPTPTGTASSLPRRPHESQPLPRGRDRLLYTYRAGWSPTTKVGKTLVSSSMIDRVAGGLGRPVVEVPVGFKWFVPGLLDGSLGFGGEEAPAHPSCATTAPFWTHRQGRDPAAAVGRRDHCRHRAEPVGPVPRTHPAARRSRVRPHRCAGDPRTEGGAGEAVAEQVPRRTGRRTGDRDAHRAPGNGAATAASRSPRRTRGLPPARPGPRTCTRSTPNPSVPRTSRAGTRPPLKTSFPAHWDWAERPFTHADRFIGNE